MFTSISLSEVINIILTVLIGVQWFWNRSKEHSVKNNIFAIRRMVSELLSHTDKMVEQKSKDIAEVVNSTLATLGARYPFSERLGLVIEMIQKRNALDVDSNLPIANDEKV